MTQNNTIKFITAKRVNYGEAFCTEWAMVTWCVTCERYESCPYEHKVFGEKF